MTGEYLPCKLSNKAAQDLENIFDYTATEFGTGQAVVYLSSLELMFKELEHNPKLGRARSEFNEPLRSLVKEHHVILYCIEQDFIQIVRVLHCSSNALKHLASEL